MMKSFEYTVLNAADRQTKRAVFSGTDSPRRQSGSRTFVPFTGFDGQKLAGTGALVFEGELLELKGH